MSEATWTLGGGGGGLSPSGDGSSASAIMRRFSGLHTLARLRLSSNKLYGSIPPALAHDAVQLVYFDGTVNLLSGTLPEAIFGMTLLGEFAITKNGIAGAIPQALCCLQRLHLLRLGRNRLSEAIHKLICCLPSSLRRMQLQLNSLSGYLPSCLGSLSSLKAVRVGKNNIGGSIPDSLRCMTELEHFQCFGQSNSRHIASWCCVIAGLWRFKQCHNWCHPGCMAKPVVPGAVFLRWESLRGHRTKLLS